MTAPGSEFPMMASEKATYHDFSSVSVEELFTRLQSSGKGLTAEVANKRMKEQVKSYKSESRFKTEIKLLARQFINPLVLLLVIAVALSAVLGQSSDSIIILFILLTTGLLGFWQESYRVARRFAAAADNPRNSDRGYHII
jgi:magnesium-transporting ATPase (P-type)